jgi:hypothetical protein
MLLINHECTVVGGTSHRPSINKPRYSQPGFFSDLADVEGKKGNSGDGTKRPRGRTSLREGGVLSDESAVTLLQVTEEISTITEILWLIRSSVMFKRLVLHTKRTNLVKPTDNMNQYLLTVV